jgi:PPOX class probable F420-dependent enzyme
MIDSTAPATLTPDVRALLASPNYVHLATLRPDGAPRSWVVWVGVEGDRLLVCTDDRDGKAKDMLADPRVALSVHDAGDPYKMAHLRGRVVEVRPDHDCRHMDRIARKYTGRPFPARGPHRLCFVIAVDRARSRTLGFEHRPA